MDAAAEITKEAEASRLLDAVLVTGNVQAAARSLDIPYHRARKLYKEQLKAYWDDNADKAELVAAKELRKLDIVERPVMKQALEGDLRAVDRLLAISKARREIIGVDAAKRVEVQFGAVDTALADIAAMIDGTVAAKPLRLVEGA